MRNVALLLLLFVALSSCKKHQSKQIIPKDKFSTILTDIYMVDGYYMLKSNRMYQHDPNSDLYKSVLKRYGYTTEDFDTTMKYYVSQKKAFDPIVDKVITNLNKIQQEVYLLQQYADTSRNLFKQKTQWSLPKDGPREMIPFKIAIKDTGMYSIVVQLKVFNDDQSKDPHLTAYFWYDDGTKKGHIDYIPFIVYKKTDNFVVLSTKKRNRNKKVTHIKGWILNHNNDEISFKKHIEVKSIIIAKN